MENVIVIPALNPKSDLIEYIDTLISNGRSHILLVDDGSRDDCRFIFDTIEKKDECTVLRHEVNLGKGRALKDAMTWYFENYLCGKEDLSSAETGGIITVDSDGQHTVEDVAKVAAAMDESPDALILGARDFNTGNVPPKSMFGNKCTRVALKLFIGGDIHDTQTGLRGIPNSLIDRFRNLSGDRFEYETGMLIDAIKSRIDIREVPIQTIYINDNSETHFNPIVDSIRIYRVIFGTFFRYLLSSLSSFLVDYGIFCALIFAFGKTSFTQNRSVWIATVISRICSSLFNYTVNRKLVFRSSRGLSTLAMYYALCIAVMAASAALVSLIGNTGFPVQIAKIIVDTLLFIVSYRVQKTLIFK